MFPPMERPEGNSEFYGLILDPSEALLDLRYNYHNLYLPDSKNITAGNLNGEILCYYLDRNF